MRKFFSLFICICLLFSMNSVVLADETKSTTVKLIGEASYSYEFNVPTTMTVGETKTTTLSGTWGDDTIISVTAPSKVTLVNINSDKKKDLAVTYSGFNVVGNNYTAISETSDISVENIEVLFGNWEGIIVYTLTMDSNNSVVEVIGSLQDAIDNAENGTTLRLMSDIEESVIIAEGQNLTIDLNGYDIIGNLLTGSKESHFGGTNYNTYEVIDIASAITNHGTLRVIGNGTVDGRTDRSCALFNTGVAVLQGGTYIRSTEDCTEVGVTYDDMYSNSHYTIQNVGTLTINGATIESQSIKSSALANGWNAGGTAAPYYGMDGTIIINSGIVQGGRHAITNNIGDITMNGGTVLALEVGGKDAIGIDSGNVEINDGIIYSSNIAMTVEGDSIVTINGGSITGEINIEDPAVVTDNR